MVGVAEGAAKPPNLAGGLKMPDDVPITDLLGRVQAGDRDALTKLTEHFWQLARQTALRDLSKYPVGVREYAGGSIIGIEALRSALRYVGRSDKVVADRNQFYKLLRAVIRNKIVNIARYESRGNFRWVNLGEEEFAGRELEPVEKLVRKETEDRLAKLAQRVTELIRETKDEIELVVGELGVLRFYSARQIREALISAYPDRKPPSISAIHVMLRRIRKRLARELGEEVGDE
jgi:hypothetical protein